MSKIRNQVKIHFERLGHTLYQNRLKALFVVFLFIGFLVYQIPKITIDTSAEALLRKNDPSLLQYNAFRDQFGRAELIIIAVKAPEVFDAGFLAKLKSFHGDLENEVPYIREVTSLINARNIRGEGDVLFVEELLGGWPEKNIDLASLKDFVLKNPLYQNHLISEDGRITAILIETEASISKSVSEEDLLSGFEEDTSPTENGSKKPHYFSEKENREVVEAVNRVVDRYQSPEFILALSGGPIIVDAFNRATLSDIRFCIVLSMIAVAFFLAIFFRRISGIILPMTVIISSMVSTMGLMALCNVPIKITTTVIPGFLLAVGVADSVHILAIFYRSLKQGKSKEDAIAYALGHSGSAIVMTSLTTAAGLLSFSFAELTAIAEIGIFAAAGVILALFYTIIMLPAIIALFPIKEEHSTGADIKSSLMDRVLLSVSSFSTSHPTKILAVSLVMFFVSIVFILQLRFSHNVIHYFPDTMAVKKDLFFIDKELKGTITLEIILDTNKENGIYEPAILNRIEKLSRSIESINNIDIFVGKVFSINDIIKEINQALHGNDTAYYTIPQARKTIAQELFLFENSGSDDLERIVDSQFQKTRITIKTPWVDAIICNNFIEDIKNRFNDILQDKADITITGGMALMSRVIMAAIYSMARSYVIAFLVITLMMILFIGDIKIGLISMIPNLLPILIIMGIMGFAKVPLTMNTLLIGSIAMGLVVDDTIHFIHNFQRYYKETEDAHEAIKETLLSTGRALLITSLVLATGFFVLMFATLNHLVRFGFFTGMAILIALLADFLLAPALMILVTRRKQKMNT